MNCRKIKCNKKKRTRKNIFQEKLKAQRESEANVGD